MGVFTNQEHPIWTPHIRIRQSGIPQFLDDSGLRKPFLAISDHSSLLAGSFQNHFLGAIWNRNSGPLRLKRGVRIFDEAVRLLVAGEALAGLSLCASAQERLGGQGAFYLLGCFYGLGVAFCRCPCKKSLSVVHEGSLIFGNSHFLTVRTNQT